ncbi:MAG: type IV pilin protein [Ideonella sp.]
MKLNLHRGFTLIEVMIVVAIVAILAVVAFPAYTDYIRRGQIPEAFTALSDFQVKMEQYYQDNRKYGVSTCANTSTASWATFPSGKYFDYFCSVPANGQGFLLRAAGKSGSRATGYEYTVNDAGQKFTIKFAGATVSKTCWAVKSADC